MAGRYQFARNTKYFLVVIVLNVSRFIVVPKFLGGTARHGTARHGTARHGTARHGTARHGTARHGTARHGTARYGDVAEWSAGSFANASGRGVGNG
jgi:hypothetical protein